MATWTGSPRIRSAAPIRACCGRTCARSIMLGVNYGPDENPLAILERAHARRDLGLCAGRRLSRPDQEAAEGAGAMAGRRVRLRGQGVRRHRRGDGKAAGAGGGPRLAGQAHQSRLARIRLVAVSRRDLHDARSAARRGRAPIIAAPAGPASTSARRRRFPRPTSSMRGAAFPISPSRTRGRSRTNFAKPSATASMAATIASRSARGTNSRKPAARQNSPRATNLRAPELADLARLDDAAFRALFAKSPVKRIGRDRFIRNVLIAIGNSNDRALGDRGRAPARRRKPAGARRRGMGAVAIAGAGGVCGAGGGATLGNETRPQRPCGMAARRGRCYHPAAGRATADSVAALAW